MNYKKIVGVESLTEEVVTVLSKSQFADFQKYFKLGTEVVEFIENIKLFDVFAKNLNLEYFNEPSAGGTIANTLYNFSFWNHGDSKNWKIILCGNYDGNSYSGSINPLDSLRRLGIELNLSQNNGITRKALCLIDNISRDVQKILVGPNIYEVDFESELDNCDYLVITMHRLDLISDECFKTILEIFGKIILVIADFPLQKSKALHRMLALGKKKKLKYIFGYYQEFKNIGLGTKDFIKSPLAKTEIIGTNGQNEVIIWDPLPMAEVSYKTQIIKSEKIISTLGAGDAYCGAYLWQRLNGKSIETAHLNGNQQAIKTLTQLSARPTWNTHLKKLFGKIMKGREGKDGEDEHYFDIVRNNCGTCILSCGHTGIDQLGLKIGNSLGLANYALLPKGLRNKKTENISLKIDQLENVFLTEYSSSSYRYATYSTVFASDGTLIFDYANGEGSQATRDACKLLGRPFLDCAYLNLKELLSCIEKWIIKNGIRIINVAGNRIQFLTNKQILDCCKKLELIFKRISWASLNNWSIPSYLQNNIQENNNPIQLAVSNSNESKLLIWKFLRDMYKVNPDKQKEKLCWNIKHPSLKIFFVRSRDIPYITKSGFCQIGLCGDDIIEESKLNFNYRIKTGLQPCLMVLINNGTKKKIKSIATQYPNFIRKFEINKSIKSIIPIQGSAESWILGGWCDAIFDTWKTGKTVMKNNLHLIKKMQQTSLNIITDLDTHEEGFNFIDKLTRWVYGIEKT